MTWYELWKYIHVVAAMVWIGGAIVAQVFGVLTQRARDPARSVAFGRDVYWIATRVFLPSSLVVLASGLALKSDGHWDWSEPFLWLGLLLWGIVVALAFGYVAPALARTGARIAAEGPSPELLGRVSRLIVFARVLIGVLLVIVFLMVVKPGT